MCREWGRKLMKSLRDRDGWAKGPTPALIPPIELPPPSPAAMACIVYLHNHLPFSLLLPFSSFSPSLPPGKPVMIITEYMENGSLDAFLRVSLCSRVGV